ncbi:MAG: hypothetical protein JOY76_05660, partial [Hyphomicrobiales bacterium]|nr:hypothetical protein [Hyphomicrobiales bacterium]
VLPEWPGLYFMGLLNLNGAANQAYERQAPWIVAMETGEAELPSRDEMEKAMMRKARWVKRYYPDTPRHTIEEEPIRYFRELRLSLRDARARARRRSKAAWLARARGSIRAAPATRRSN